MNKNYIKSVVDSGVLIVTMHDTSTRTPIGLNMIAELEQE